MKTKKKTADAIRVGSTCGSPARHRIARISRGKYNYRGYCISRYRKAWEVYDEDGVVAAQKRTLLAMKRLINKWERIAEAEALANVPDQPRE